MFDGFLTSISPSDSGGGNNQLSLNCRDSLELARISTEMINPSVIQVDEIIKQQHINIFSQPMYGLDHLEIFKTMFLGGKLLYDPEKNKLRPESPTFNRDASLNFMSLGNYAESSDNDPSKISPDNLSELYSAIHKNDFSIEYALKLTSHKHRPRFVSMWGSGITPYRLFSTTSPQVFTAEFSTRLDIIQNIAQMVYFNFYVDGFGTIHYHPMRMGNEFLYYDIITNAGGSKLIKHPHLFPGSQIIGPHETFSKSLRANVEELTTFMRVTGQNPFISSTEPEKIDLIGSAIDLDKMARFGYRRKSVQNPLFNFNVMLPGKNGKKVSFMDLVAKSLMQYMNSELYTLQTSIQFRPELQIARPVFTAYDSDIFYCNSLSHTININSDATTNLNANFGRKELEMAPDLFTFILISEGAFRLNGEIPSLSAQASDEEIQEYYQRNFSINELQFLEWIDQLDKYQQQFSEYEKLKSQQNSTRSS